MSGTVAVWVVVGLLSFGVGSICGWLLGLTGFIESIKDNDFKSSVRLKNFQYLVAGLVVAFAADYRKVGLGADFPSVLPALSFVFGAIPSFLLTVRNVRASIRRSVERWNKAHRPLFQIDVDSMVRLYDERGKREFDETFSSHKKEIEKQQTTLEAISAETERAARRQRHIEANKAISRCVYTVIAYRPRGGGDTEPEKRRRAELIEAVLDAGCAAVRAHARHPDTIQLSGSFMRFIASAQASPEVRARARFTFENRDVKASGAHEERYQGYLELQHGAGFSSGNEVVLPVEKASADKAASLPGAPEAARSMGFAIMNVRPADRSAGIPSEVWDAIDAFFGGVNFQSVTSICIHDTHGVLGVMNVESSERDLLGEDREAATAACATLQPVAALLTKFAQR